MFFFFVVDSGNKIPILGQLFGSNPDDQEQGSGLTSVHQISGWLSYQNWAKNLNTFSVRKNKYKGADYLFGIDVSSYK